MKKQVLLFILVLVTVWMFTGCNLIKDANDRGETGTEIVSENSTEESKKDKNKGQFELKQENIQLEIGTELGGISEYVIADNYDEITMEFAPTQSESEDGESMYRMAVTLNNKDAFMMVPGVPPYVEFSYGDEVLQMNIEWVDTTPPAIANEDITLYAFSIVEDNGSYELVETDIKMLDLIKMTLPSDNSNMSMNNWGFENLTFGGNYVEVGENLRGKLIKNIGPETPFEFKLCDNFGNKKFYQLTANVIGDISPEDRQVLKDNGIDETEINDKMNQEIERSQR